MSTILSSGIIENKYDVYRVKNCMKTFYEFLRKRAMKIINSKKTKKKIFTKEQQKSYENVKTCYICGKVWKQIFDR